jgi:hypothetical protein
MNHKSNTFGESVYPHYKTTIMQNSNYKTFLISFALLFSSWAFGQDECVSYILGEEGVTLEHTNYDKKDKVTGRQQSTVIDISTEGGVTHYTVHAKYFDKKEDLVHESDLKMECENGKFTIDFESLVDASLKEVKTKMEELENVEITVESDPVTIPSDPKVGEELDKGEVVVTIKIMSMEMVTSVRDIERKVTAIENVTTPAGSFECVKIESVREIKSSMGGNQQISSIEYFAKNIGLVKSLTLDKKGNVETKTVLTRINK